MSTLNAEQVKALSDRINDLLPDDGRTAVTVLALNYACVACCVGLTDEQAITALRQGLKQMRAKGVGAAARERSVKRCR